MGDILGNEVGVTLLLNSVHKNVYKCDNDDGQERMIMRDGFNCNLTK